MESAQPTYSKKAGVPNRLKKDSQSKFPSFSSEFRGWFCGQACRTFLIAFNIIALLISLSLLVIGPVMIWGRDIVKKALEDIIMPLIEALATDEETQTKMTGQILASTSTIGAILLVIGTLTTLCSVLGFIGACVKHRNLLTIYCIMVFILDIVTMISFAVYYQNRDMFASKAVSLYEAHVFRYRSLEAATIDTIVVGLGSQYFACCGVDSGKDFVNLQSTDTYQGQFYSELRYPLACCKMNNAYKIVGSGCPTNFTTGNSFIQYGCREPIKRIFIKYMNNAAIGLVILFLVLIMIIIFTMLTIQSLTPGRW
ncbi:Tetraspanin-CD63 receptor [Fasciola gigantica]|uniref:Tetraspanin-CD63 receptor n=1 Tax=Fasciola gigantica TaxID=46835 RepID=A0A504YT25_FASGI|nr:Tetraspanin-CD63 receptor [Fasciola gigantica]